MSKALDQAEQIVIVGLGIGLLYGGYKLYKGVQSAASALTGAAGGPHLPGAPAGVIPGGKADYTAKSGQQCHTDVGWVSQTEQCDAPPEPDDVKVASRAARLQWGLENSNEHTILAALKMPGEDLDLERRAFEYAGYWKPDSNDGKPLGASDYNPDFYGLNRDRGNILIWYGLNRAEGDEYKNAARAGDLVTLARLASDRRAERAAEAADHA